MMRILRVSTTRVMAMIPTALMKITPETVVAWAKGVVKTKRMRIKGEIKTSDFYVKVRG
jgi:hypothetical protein